uniref:Uridylate-specific endoribonuclease n=1 Tax=Sinocyclocheilus rhinocerous TaxID=307959 RepID=A0A673M9X0_9TELE
YILSQTVNQELSNIFNELWKLDVNRLTGYIPQGSTSAVDHASSSLFTSVDEAKLNSITTYLLDNYERSTGVAERVTAQEVTENNSFLDAILETAVMKFYLQEKQEILDYKGYKARDNDVPNEDDHVLNPVASAFVGVSPEFEMAIFTILFLTSTEKTTTAVVNLDEYQLEMVVHRRGRSIGTAYPKLLSSNNRHV